MSTYYYISRPNQLQSRAFVSTFAGETCTFRQGSHGVPEDWSQRQARSHSLSIHLAAQNNTVRPTTSGKTESDNCRQLSTIGNNLQQPQSFCCSVFQLKCTYIAQKRAQMS